MVNKIEELRNFVEEKADGFKNLNDSSDVVVMVVLNDILDKIDELQNGKPMYIVQYQDLKGENTYEDYSRYKSASEIYYYQIKAVAKSVKLLMEVDGIRVTILDSEGDKNES
ncbi:prohead protease [Bacillus phage SWEP1]|nr:prohead protease [Bacillus phage SWEP1]